jgi:Tfp pilus assembly protein PilO
LVKNLPNKMEIQDFIDSVMHKPAFSAGLCITRFSL